MATHTTGRPIPVEHHPQASTYVKVALVLAVFTAIEVAVYYIDFLRQVGLLAPILLCLSAIKFTLVVMYYMHLKFDPRPFTALFISGLACGAFILLTVVALFGYFVREIPPEQRGPSHPKVAAAAPARAGAPAVAKPGAPPAVDPASIGDPAKGKELFTQKTCIACHMAPGVPGGGTVGPNQEHYATRPTTAGGTLPNTPENTEKWLSNPPAVKPGTLMPNLNLSPQEIKDLTAFLYTLK